MKVDEIEKQIADFIQSKVQSCVDPHCQSCEAAQMWSDQIRLGIWRSADIQGRLGLVPPPGTLELPEWFLTKCHEANLDDPKLQVETFLAWNRGHGKLARDWLSLFWLWMQKHPRPKARAVAQTSNKRSALDMTREERQAAAERIGRK